MLSRYLPPSWLSITDSSARLGAALVLTPGVTVDVGGAAVTTLTLIGGTTPPEAASLYTGGGRLVLHGVTVSSSDRAFHGVLPPTAGRPFIVVSSGGRLEAIDVTISDLGTPDTDRENRAGVQFTTGSSGSLVRTSLLRNSTGLRLGGAQDVHLDGVTIRESTGAGLVLSGDRGTTMSGIRVERNGGNGVRVTGTGTGRPVTGISTARNGGFGIAAVGATSTRITGVATSNDKVGGLELSQSRDVTVSDSTATDEPIGVFTHIGSTDVALDRMTIIGGRRGVEIEKTTKSLTMRATTISSARVAGVAIGGAEVELRDVLVRDSGSGVRVERGAQGVTAIGLRLSGGRDGVVTTPGTSRVVLRDLRAYDIENDAVRTFSPDTRILGGTITGATTGITAGAATTISGTTITLVNAGIRTRSTSLVHAEDLDVDAITVGIDVAPGSPFLLSGSRVHALEAVRGQLTQQGVNHLSLPPLNLLSTTGLPLVLLAIGLELVHSARQHRSGRGGTNRWTPPALPPAARPSTEPSTGFAHPTRSDPTGSPRVDPPHVSGNVTAARRNPPARQPECQLAIGSITEEDTISRGADPLVGR
jgi:hypothetical protein